MASRNTPGTSASNLTKQQRREQAREKARLLQEEEARRAKRSRRFIILLSTLTALLVVGIVIAVVYNGFKNQEEKAARPKPTGIATPGPNVSDSGAITIGKGDQEGTTSAAKKNSGKPTVRIYSDYMCVHCNELEKEYGHKLVNLAAQGEINLEIVPLSILGQEISTVATQADYYIAQEAPEYYAAFHNKFFSEISAPIFAQQKGLPEASRYKEVTIDIAKQVGVPEDVQKGLRKVLDENRYADYVTHASKVFHFDKYTGTPTVVINGEKFERNWTNGALLKEIEKKAGHSLKATDDAPAVPSQTPASDPSATSSEPSEQGQPADPSASASQ